MQMKKVILFVIFCISLIVCANAQEESYIGEWQGTLQVPGQELEVTVEFLFEEDQLFGFIDIPLQQAIDLPLSIISHDSEGISFAIKDVLGDPIFYGKLSDDSNSLAGEFTQGGSSFSFSLTKKSEAEKQQEATKLQQKLETIRTFIDTTMSTWHVAGLSVAVVKDDEVIMSEGFGYRNYEQQLPVTSQTIFAIGSSSKAFTAFSVGLLVDEGLIEWDTPVKEYLPDFKMDDDFATKEMTAIDLLTHRSGLPRHDLMWYGANFSREEMFERLRYLEPNEPFRYTFQYQNLMYMTAGLLVGRMTNSTWENVVYDRIFQPLGMTNSNFSVDASQVTNDFSLPYRVSEEDTNERMKFMNISQVGPAGSINSCADDMAQWVKLLLNKGKIDDTQLMQEATVNVLTTPHMFISGISSNPEITYRAYGLGWFIMTYRGHAWVQHGGNIDGFSAMVNLLPNDNIGFVILTNQNNSIYTSIASYYIIDHMLDLDPVDWHGRTLDSIDEVKDVEEGVGKLERVENTKPSHKMEDYVGIYENPGYGRFQIDYTGRELYMLFHSFASPLEHWHYDVFKPTEGMLEQSNILLEFQTNLQGMIHKLSVPLEQSVSPIEFEKLPPGRMSDPTYLLQFTGTYTIAGDTINVELNASRELILEYPGQTLYGLHPYAENEFKIGDYKGYFVKFHLEKDEVTGLSFVQPNGIFEADKVEE